MSSDNSLYLPYSKESRALYPLWEKLAETFEEHEDVVTDINLSVQGAYPSLCFFPALYAERVVVYTGKKKLKPLIKFVEKEMEKANKYRVTEDEDRRKYIEAMKAEEAKKANNTKDDFNTTTKT